MDPRDVSASKNELQPTRANFSRFFLCKMDPRWLERKTWRWRFVSQRNLHLKGRSPWCLVTLAKNGGKNRSCHADYLEMLLYSRLNFPALSVKKIAFITEVIKSTIENKIASIFCVIQLYLFCEKYFYQTLSKFPISTFLWKHLTVCGTLQMFLTYISNSEH